MIQAIDRIEASVRERHPIVERIYLEVDPIRATAARQPAAGQGLGSAAPQQS